MANPLIHNARRGLPGMLAVAAVTVLLITARWLLDNRLYNVAELSGWLLFTLLLLLMVYQLRKKVPMLPLGRAWFWRRVHTWFGWLALAVFVLHAGWAPPAGHLNMLLWWFMLLVFVSGIFGLLMSIVLPARITQGEQRLQLERIPRLRAGLLRRADYLMARLAKDPGTQPLTDFYTGQIRDYLFRPREFFAHCFNAAGRARRLGYELATLSRYMGQAAEDKALQLREVIEDKHRLDRQYALQQVLKIWSYVHVAFSLAVLLVVLLHILVIYAYHLEIGF